MGQEIRGDRPALKQRAGRIRAGGTDAEVTFTPVDRGLNDRIDDAYSAKYAGSPCLPPIISERTRAATATRRSAVRRPPAESGLVVLVGGRIGLVQQGKVEVGYVHEFKVGIGAAGHLGQHPLRDGLVDAVRAAGAGGHGHRGQGALHQRMAGRGNLDGNQRGRAAGSGYIGRAPYTRKALPIR